MRAIAVFSPTRAAGKSWFATALCRWLKREDWSVVPFQAQADVQSGYTISQSLTVSYSAAWQAWAAGLPVSANFNPVLLRPLEQPSQQYQLFIKGRGIGTVSRSDYYQNYYGIAKPLIQESLQKLQENHNLMVFDTYRHGLYNPWLTDTDESFQLLKSSSLHPAGVIIVNCQDGGAINQLWGFWQRLSQENRKIIRGVVFNQSWGDRRIADVETRWVKENLKRPVLGHIPTLSSQYFQPESPLTFSSSSQHSSQSKLTIKILRLPNLSCHTDLDALESEPSVNLSYFDPADQLGYPDAVIVPHTTKAIADLEFLHEYNGNTQLQEYAAAGGTVLGLCNGANLLGKHVTYTNANGKMVNHPGLELLLCNSILYKNVSGEPEISYTFSGEPFPNLPIQGERVRYSKVTAASKTPLIDLFSDPDLGFINQGKNVWAIHLHQVLNNGPWRRFWLNQLRQKRGLASLPTGIADFTERREVILDNLAQHLDKHVDLAPLLTDYDY